MIRRVLLLQASDSRTDLRPALIAADWAFEHVQSPGSMAVDSHAGECAVGIAVIDEPTTFNAGDLSAAVARTDIEWVAVTSPEVLRVRDIASVLARAFFDFHTLPLDARRLLFTLGHALGKAALRRQVAERVDELHGRFGMVGNSQPMLELYRVLEKVVRVDAPVLLSGESGTGKEIAALAVHRESQRRSGPFIAVNCGAIPATLMQAQLFGHEKGSFTGAHQRQIGSFEAANGGVIFLDEIGDLPLESQASLLRFMQESTITRLGSTRPIKIDARVVAATHVDLVAAVRAGHFREDLFYRLNVLHVEMPALRSRPDDIPLLAEHVFELYRSHKAPDVRGLSSEAIEAMTSYAWPGNVRELINRVHKAMIMCDATMISAADLGLSRGKPIAPALSLAKARLDSERDHILAALDRNTYNMAATARELGVSRVTLYRLAQRLAIQPRGRRFGSGAVAHAAVDDV
jgi:DNA-binding NtrC family response regulator